MAEHAFNVLRRFSRRPGYPSAGCSPAVSLAFGRTRFGLTQRADDVNVFGTVMFWLQAGEREVSEDQIPGAIGFGGLERDGLAAERSADKNGAFVETENAGG